MDLINLQLTLGRLYGQSTKELRRLYDEAFADVSPGSPVPPPTLPLLFEHSADVRARFDQVDPRLIQEDRHWIESEGIHLLDLWSPGYPPLLAAIHRAPVLLYVQGRIDSVTSPQLAMVGSRKPSISGQKVAQRFASHLSLAGLTITSGLAEGIDAFSHEAALQAGGLSVAVLGTGIDEPYPRIHHRLARRIAAQGALVSELPPRSPPLARNFPLRNRIISGLSQGVLVVEAALGSGSLHTARAAVKQDRPLFAIPGSIHNPLARGCHALIRGGARLTEDPIEILQRLEIGKPKQLVMALEKHAPHTSRDALALDKPYKILLDAVGFEATSVDELVERTGLSCQSVSSMLLRLELAGAVGGSADGQYMRLSPDNHAKQRF
jgi:DNA processing protein